MILGLHLRSERILFFPYDLHLALYHSLAYKLASLDPLTRVGVVEGDPDIDDLVPGLCAAGVRRAFLLPFMAVAGDHARNDMAGEDEDSWASVLTREGIEPVPVLRGTAEMDEIVDIWVDHLGQALERLGGEG